jgi:hypothetical protein
MTNLKVLFANGFSGVDQEGIANLNLVEFEANYNPRIFSVTHMTNLKFLMAGGICGIDQAGIAGLNLTELYSRGNPKITSKLA